MRGYNILNKQGFLTKEDRKKPLEHGCDHFTFKTCLDLSEPIKVIPYSMRDVHTIQDYSQDVARFMVWWTKNVFEDLNGFSGMHIANFELVGFTLE